MTITPTVTVGPAGMEITTSAPGIDYNAMVSGLGEAVFQVVTLYYRSEQLAQLFHPLRYQVFDANGNNAGETLVTPVSGQQYQASEFVQLKSKGVYINGQSALNIDMLPNNEVQFIVYAVEKRNQDVIDLAGDPNNLKKIESEMGMPGFFQNSTLVPGCEEEVFPEI